MKNFLKLYFLWLITVLPIIFFCLFENIWNYFYDFFMINNLKTQKVSENIVIIWVDSETVKYFWESWNWTRSRYEWLLQELISQKPKVILFDYFFSTKTIPENFDWDLYQKITNSSTEKVDEIYEKYENTIYEKNYLSTIDSDFWNLIKSSKNVVLPYSYRVDINWKFSKDYDVYPIETISENAKLWYANIDFSNDWVIRSRTQNINNSKSISQVISEIYLQKNVRLNNNLFINYFSLPYDKYTAIQFHNAYNWVFYDYNWNKIDLKDKIILVWDYHESLWDTYKTPVSKDALSPWVEIIANEVQSIIENKWIVKIDIFYQIIILFFVYTIIFSLLFITKNIYLMVFYSIFNLIIWYLVTWELFKKYIYFDFKNLLFTIFIAYVVVFSYKILKNYFEKLKIKKEFSRYMDKKLVENILNNEDVISKQKNVSILFLDIEWFTDMSEKLDNKELVKITNKIFWVFNDIILKNNWIIDKYIWDSIMVFWEENSVSNHAFLACKTALEIYKSLGEINNSLEKKINIRIWVNSWEVIIWNIWDENFSDYTIIWDNVNLASRLEWINKYYATRIIISENTFSLLKDEFIIRELDNIKVKWKNNWVRIYELIWDKNTDINKDFLSNHQIALESYYKKDFEKSLTFFEKNLSLASNDETTNIFIKRIKEYQKKSKSL